MNKNHSLRVGILSGFFAPIDLSQFLMGGDEDGVVDWQRWGRGGVVPIALTD